MSTRQNQLSLTRRNARRMTTPFKEFAKYEDGKNRALRFDVNALADFEQETGMGFAQLMKQKAIFASARAMLWAGMKHEDRGISIEYVGELLGEYMTDEDVPPGDHTIDTILMVAFDAAIEQGALGLKKKVEPEEESTAAAVDGQTIEAETVDPTQSRRPNPVRLWWTDWIADAEPYAYTELRLLPWDFYRLTPREFAAMVEGHRKRQRARLRQEAAWVCVIANSGGHMKRTITVQDLIGLEPEDMAKIIRKRDRQFREKLVEKSKA